MANFGQVTKKIEALRKELQQLESADPIQRRAEILSIRHQLDELLYREELMWLQRSRISWLKDGDPNTRYFHRKARWRAKKNWVRKLEREDDSWCMAQPEMLDMTQSFFSNLFTADQAVNPDDVVNLFDQKIMADMNQVLCRDFSEEISDAPFQIGPLSAPIPISVAPFVRINWIYRKRMTEWTRDF